MESEKVSEAERDDKPATLARNLIICCDGTSNEPAPVKQDSGLTNVVYLFRCLVKDESQIVYYDPGIGALNALDPWRRNLDWARMLVEQATGYGLDDHVIGAYRFLCEHYREGDRISLFGFSRGAYSVRVLAGVIHHIGLLRPDQRNLAEFALKAYKQSSELDDFRIGGRFARALGAQPATIHFLGLWDTVGSMIAPLKDRIGLGLTHLPFTRKNPSVARVRHAMSIDERRRMFRLTQWQAIDFVANRFEPSIKTPQDVQQVWFAGAHGDVGGGHVEAESGLSKLSLRWMIGEAAAAGLKISSYMATRATTEHFDKRGALLYCAEDPLGKIHPQPEGRWWAMEVVPKTASSVEWDRRPEWPDRKVALGLYIPAGEPRPLQPQDWIHESVATRMATGYAPENLGADPARYRIATTRPI
jgi:uncharacterized protein (DUF2235 family)